MAKKEEKTVELYWQRVGVVKGCGDPQISRARVPGGWALLSRTGGMVFVPDKDGTWDGSHESIEAKTTVESHPMPADIAPPPAPPPVVPVAALAPVTPRSDADLLPDVDPNIVASEIGSVGGSPSIVEDHRDDSLAAVGEGFDEPQGQTMEQLQARVAAVTGTPAAPVQESTGKLVKGEALEGLRLALAEMGSWVLEEYEHPNTKARKLWKVVMAAAAAVIPEG